MPAHIRSLLREELCSSALFMFICFDCGNVSGCEPVMWQLLRRLLLLLQHCIATMEGRLCGCFCAALLLRRLSRGRCGAALQNTASVVADPAAVVRPHAIAAETALYTQPISAVEGLHHAEGVETAGHAEGAEHVCHPCMHACVCVRGIAGPTNGGHNTPSDPTRLWCDRTCARRDVAGMGTPGCL